MENHSQLGSYENRFKRVTSYIYEHLAEDLDLIKLADIACMSAYHWHRIYHAMHGETLAATVKRLRLHRAAGFLVHSDLPVDQVAVKSGYANLQSFTRIFHSVYGMPPARYRKEGSHTVFQQQQANRSSHMYPVEIKTVPAIQAVTVDHTGSYMDIGKAFETMYGCLASRQLFRPGMRSIGIYLDDPFSVEEAALRSKAGVVFEGPIPAEALLAPLAASDVAGGTYAVLRYKGPYADMRVAYQWLYGEWLAQSGKEAADAPAFEEYLNNPRDTAPTELLTDIYLPLR
ncbi:AraC family transcriptional regulator [Undibacterium terreum]|uniref:AraC family transcriptional regulator n=1 Tax=Undibacterium terreum TaxID=1224302 RepID=A0A916XHI4_9BURK|nr:AraC family transcriptional regulator [Undibacterium terreum]GGC70843.1 AraC family transcriptional regulator [Undibacterium terreum]